MASGRLLIKDGHVLTLDPSLGDFERADVLIEDGRIAAVEPVARDRRLRGPGRCRKDRDAGLRGHPPPHLADGAARHLRGLDAPGLLQGHPPEHLDGAQSRGHLRRQLCRRARGPRRRSHEPARLLSLQQHPGPCRRGRFAGSRTPGSERSSRTASIRCRSPSPSSRATKHGSRTRAACAPTACPRAGDGFRWASRSPSSDSSRSTQHAVRSRPRASSMSW